MQVCDRQKVWGEFNGELYRGEFSVEAGTAVAGDAARTRSCSSTSWGSVWLNASRHAGRRRIARKREV